MADTSPEALSERERQILNYLADGLSNQEIANKLFLADQTVRWYCSQLYGKLSVSNRREAVERAQALGLLTEASIAPVVTGKHNLPAQATPFIGRQTELLELSTLLKDDNTRLITVLAPGGMGKTRLALEAARLQIGHYADGVIFVPLAPLGNPNDIITAIAENIGFIFHGENAPAEQLNDFLRERSMLLVLDNFEHLLDGTQVVADFMQVATHLRIVTTSRERLNLQSETVYTLRGLEFPTWETPEDALQYDAVILFMQSALRVRSDFALHAHDLDFLARICRLTAGMPLGIQLAAGWVDVFSLEQIAAEIQKGIDILETDLRDVPERQRSVRATFNRTWERLTEDEQAVFRRLSVFRSGFTFNAAEVIAGASGRSLRQLANKALVQVAPDGRHDIHELLRQFGAEKLASSGEQPTIQAKHAAYFVDFLQERRGAIFGSQQLEALNQIGVDFENVRSAWNVLVDQQAFHELPKILDALWLFLDLQSRNQEGVELFEQMVNVVQSLPTSDTNELALGRLYARLAWCYNDIGLSEKGIVTGETAIRLLDRHDSPQDLLVIYVGLGTNYALRGEGENLRQIAQKAYELAGRLGNRFWEAHILLQLSHAARLFNDDKDALLRPLRQVRVINEDLQNPWCMLMLDGFEAAIAFEAGDFAQAKNGFAQAHILARAFGHVFNIANSASFLGIMALSEGNYAQAADLLRQALRTFWDAGYAHFALGPMVCTIQLLLHEDKPELAIDILALTKRYPGYHGLGVWNVFGRDRLEAMRQDLKTRLGTDRFDAAWARSEQRELSEVINELLSDFDA